MSTRANILIKEEHKELWFYRHADGYPSGVEPTLGKFCRWVKERRIRDNVEQASGWLIVLGVDEMNKDEERVNDPLEPEGGIMGWKVGTYEPTTGKHGDIEFLYEVDLPTKQVTCKSASGKVLFTVAFGESWPQV